MRRARSRTLSLARPSPSSPFPLLPPHTLPLSPHPTTTSLFATLALAHPGQLPAYVPALGAGAALRLHRSRPYSVQRSHRAHTASTSLASPASPCPRPNTTQTPMLEAASPPSPHPSTPPPPPCPPQDPRPSPCPPPTTTTSTSNISDRSWTHRRHCSSWKR